MTIQVIAKVNETFQAKLSQVDLLAAPTVAKGVKL